MKIERPQPTRADAALLRNTVLKLTAPGRVATVAVIVLAALLWWWLLHRVIRFGQELDYSGLEALGPQVLGFVQQYNPFFWWGVVAICTLIIAYFLYGFVDATNQRIRAKRVDADIVALLASRLSAPALQVLRWSWQNRREPITVGVLQQTRHELASGRASKIALAEQHAALLDISARGVEAEQPLPDENSL